MNKYTTHLPVVLYKTVCLFLFGGLTCQVNLSAQGATLTNSNFQTAVDLWFSDQASAISTYGHIKDWNVSGVTTMHSAFKDRTDFNENITGWDVSNVTNMGQMFRNASAFNQPIGNWDVSSVIYINSMFGGATSFNQSIGDWNVSSVTNMGNMFWRASSFNQQIGDWDVSSVTLMHNLFNGAAAFNQAIGDWDVSSVTNMGGIFNGATAFNQVISDWDVSKVTNMGAMFNGASTFNQPIGDWDVSSVIKMYSMFNGASSFNQRIDDWDISSVTDMRSMFKGATSFDLPIRDWYVSNVNTMENMFNGASSFNQPIGNWNVSNVTNMKSLFLDAAAFNQPIEDWDISSVTTMENIFDGAESLSLANRKKIHAAFSSNPNWTYDWGTFYRPVPQVKSVQPSDDLNYTFNGEVLANGGMPVTMVAFELADNMLFRNAQNHPANLVDGNFSIGLILEGGKRYYYRAVAANEVGISRSGPKRLETPASQTYWWSDALLQGGGWKTFPWFGTFRPYENGWIYHLKLGWVFVHPEETSGLWLWKKNMGWIWTKEGVYPYFWKNHDGSWQYLVGSINSSPIFQEWREDFSRTN